MALDQVTHDASIRAHEETLQAVKARLEQAEREKTHYRERLHTINKIERLSIDPIETFLLYFFRVLGIVLMLASVAACVGEALAQSRPPILGTLLIIAATGCFVVVGLIKLRASVRALSQMK